MLDPGLLPQVVFLSVRASSPLGVANSSLELQLGLFEILLCAVKVCASNFKGSLACDVCESFLSRAELSPTSSSASFSASFASRLLALLFEVSFDVILALRLTAPW